MNDVINELMKTMFDKEDNEIAKNLKDVVKYRLFTNRQKLHYAVEDLLTFLKTHFTGTDGNRDKAKKLLEKPFLGLRIKDAI